MGSLPLPDHPRLRSLFLNLFFELGSFSLRSYDSSLALDVAAHDLSVSTRPGSPIKRNRSQVNQHAFWTVVPVGYMPFINKFFWSRFIYIQEARLSRVKDDLQAWTTFKCRKAVPSRRVIFLAMFSLHHIVIVLQAICLLEFLSVALSLRSAKALVIIPLANVWSQACHFMMSNRPRWVTTHRQFQQWPRRCTKEHDVLFTLRAPLNARVFFIEA